MPLRRRTPVLRRTLIAIPLLIAGFLGLARAQDRSTENVIGAYYPGGSAARYPVARVPADRLTHLFYAFARIDDGRCVIDAEAGAHFAALAELKRVHPRLRTPVVAIAISAVAVTTASLLSTFAAAITITVATRVFGYLVVCLAVPVLRRSSAPAPAFRLPFGTAIAAPSAVVSASLLATATLTEFTATLVLAVLGWITWVAYDRTRNRLRRDPVPAASA